MADSIATVVNWYGQYAASGGSSALDIAQAAAKKDWDEGLYMALGAGAEMRRGPHAMLYMGVGTPLCTRLKKDHHALGVLHIGALWLGEVAVPALPGRKTMKLDGHRNIVEWASAFFLELPNNVKKRGSPPPTSCVVCNRWFSGEDYRTSLAKPVRTWPDIIEYDAGSKQAHLVWFAPEPTIRTVEASNVKRVTRPRVTGLDG